MPFNGSGVFNRVYNWANDAANSINITASRMDTEDSGFATGLSDCVTRDGQSPWTANLPAGGFKITGLGNGSAAGDSANVGQTLQVSNNLSDLGNASTARTNLGTPTGTSGHVLPFLDGANTFSATQSLTATGTIGWAVDSTNSVGVGQFQAVNNVSSQLALALFGSTAAGTTFGISNNNVASLLVAGTNALFVGSLDAEPMYLGTAGAAQLKFTQSGGISYSGVTGGDKGAGTFNTTALYEAGTALTAKYLQVSNNLSDVTAATARTNLGVTATGADSSYCKVANNLSDVTASTARTNLGLVPDTHSGLSVASGSFTTSISSPGNIVAKLVCTTNNAGWTAGDTAICPQTNDTTTNRGLVLGYNGTTVSYGLGSGGISIIPKAGGAAAQITPADWTLTIIVYPQ